MRGIANMSTGIGVATESRNASARAVDDVQDLIGRIEEMIARLEEWGDGSAERLRRRLNETVSRARDRLIQVEAHGAFNTPGRLPRSATAVSVAALSGFFAGLLIARP
jgi:ElaB/YqjD/DUF883 family membrane-anchored ribosome-binding protein